MTIQPRRARSASVIVLALAASACSGTSDPVSGPEPTTAEPNAVTTAPPAALALADEPVDEIAVDEESGDRTTADDTSTADDDESDTHTSTDEADDTDVYRDPSIPTSGGQPGTPAPAPTNDGVPAGYTGALGQMDPDTLLFGPLAPLPTATSGTFPLTGLPGSSAAPAVVVKIDNSSKARPQAGLNDADVVIEEEVESGITRFAAIFHSTDAVVGPVRSGRTTDLSFLHSLGRAGLVYSGANSITDTLLRQVDDVANYSAARSGGFWRQTGRSAPSNLFADTADFRSVGSAPPAWFHVGTPTVAGDTVSTVSVQFPSSSATWTWDGAAWLRRQNGTAHVTADGSQVSAANVIVVETPRVATGMVDSAGSVVPEFVWAGQGNAVVFTGGQRYEGVWTRSRLSEPAVFTTAEGQVLNIAPGRTWIEIVEPGNHSSS